ncbi:MAG: ABC transporter ATP-binding protein [Candidatus Methylomirabilia bacterium]
MKQLSLSGVTKRFPGNPGPAVDALTLTVETGEIVALLGPSGAGKTTILRLIAGFDIPDDGVIEIGGSTMTDGSQFVPPELRGVGMVFQDYALFPHLTTAQNIAFGLRRLERAARERRTGEVLGRVGLEEVADRYPHELSGGQQQRVALGRALAPAPKLLLFDEPFSNLDPDLRAQVRREVVEILRTTGSTSILVTHDQEEAFTMADRVGVLNEGRLEQLDRPEEVYHWPATRFVGEFVGSADFVPGRVVPEGIETEFGLFQNQGRLPVAARVLVMIRPDDIDISPAVDGAGVIASRQFRGSEVLYGVRLPTGQLVHSSQGSTSPYGVGTRVRVQANPIHVVTFEDG